MASRTEREGEAASAPRATLYVILGSHACRTGMLMLEHKGVPYRTVELRTGLHGFAVRRLGFPGRTVPALELAGRRVQTNREIARFLDGLRPQPPLFPPVLEARRLVEDAERWGDEVFQMTARRLGLASVLHPSVALNRGADGRLGPVLFRNQVVRVIAMLAIGRLVFSVNRRTERELLAALPAMLDRIDGWIAEGVLNGAELNAADYMIGTSLAVLTYRADLKQEVESRSAGALVDRLLPEPRAAPRAANGEARVG